MFIFWVDILKSDQNIYKSIGLLDFMKKIIKFTSISLKSMKNKFKVYIHVQNKDLRKKFENLPKYNYKTRFLM